MKTWSMKFYGPPASGRGAEASLGYNIDTSRASVVRSLERWPKAHRAELRNPKNKLVSVYVRNAAGEWEAA